MMRKRDSGTLKGLIHEVTAQGAQPVFEGFKKNDNMMDPESSVPPPVCLITYTHIWCHSFRSVMPSNPIQTL